MHHGLNTLVTTIEPKFHVLHTQCHPYIMTEAPLVTLKHGFELLESEITSRRNDLQAKLKQGKSIPDEDERWLDKDTKTVDKNCVVNILRDATNFEEAMRLLSMGDQSIVRRLQTWTMLT